jgi:hypothetical protein
MSIPLVLVEYAAETSGECNNAGPCCYTCPQYDNCEQHYDEAT